jgi:hypothetical protein
MKTRILLFCFFLHFVGSHSFGQTVILNPRFNNSQSFTSKDVWNFDLINQTGKVFKTQFNAIIYNQNKDVVVEMMSNPANIALGNNSFWPNSLETKSIRYLMQSVAEIERNTNRLPGGNYTICIKLVCVDQVCETINSENGTECGEITIEESSPLLLNSPLDEEIIELTTPLLTWIPPMPSGSSPNMTYTVALFNLRDGQTPVDAISRNRPILRKKGVSENTLTFPPEIEPLVIGNKYVWYVEAWLGKLHVATSEIWQFEILKEKKKKEPEFLNYVKVNDNLATVHYMKDVLRYAYIEEYNGKQIQLSIFSLSDGKELMKKNAEVVYGENLFSENLAELPIEIGKVYKLILINQSNQSFELLFSLK